MSESWRDRSFPVICDQGRLSASERAACPRSIPWRLVERWRTQIEINHGQTLERLSGRGGLAPEELWCASRGLKLRALWRPGHITAHEAGVWLRSVVDAEIADD